MEECTVETINYVEFGKDGKTCRKQFKVGLLNTQTSDVIINGIPHRRILRQYALMCPTCDTVLIPFEPIEMDDLEFKRYVESLKGKSDSLPKHCPFCSQALCLPEDVVDAEGYYGND